MLDTGQGLGKMRRPDKSREKSQGAYPLNSVQLNQKTSTKRENFQQNRNYPKDPGRENLNRPIAKKKNCQIANPKSKIRAMQIKAIMRQRSGAQTTGHCHILD